MKRLRVRRSAVLVLSAAVALLVAYTVTRSARDDHIRLLPARPTLPAVLATMTDAPSAAVTVPPGLAPNPAAVGVAIASAVASPDLGKRLLARVADAQTGTVLFDDRGTTPGAPASTAKLLTAAAILDVHVPSDRFATTVVSAGNGTIVLVGGGDPTLSGAASNAVPTYAGAARVTDLAAQLVKAKTQIKKIVVDDSLFVGPSVSPDWDPADLGTSYASAITAVMTDGGRAAPGAVARSLTPDLAAGAELAAALGNKSLPVSRGRAPAGAERLARVMSAPVSELVTEMLQFSDNTIAEVLARQVAVAKHAPASFRGATATIRSVLARLGVQAGAGMKDGSGLSSSDRVSPAALVEVLRLVVGTGPPSAAQLHFIAGALPVAGWSGTLAARYRSAAGLKGRVRAKTGTLSGVSSLAGFVHDRSGRLLLFALDADRAVGTDAAEAALDRIVVALSHCGCS